MMGREPLARSLVAAAAAAAGMLLAFAWAGQAPAGAAGPPALDRYDIAGGCYALRSEQTGDYVAKGGGGYTATAAIGGAEKFRMQATDLGRYLFYGPTPDFMGRTLLNTVAPTTTASDDTDWTVEEDGTAFRIVNEFAGRDLVVGAGDALATVAAGSGGAAGLFTVDPVGGCAVYPEVEVNVEGTPRKGDSPFAEVVGTAEGHMHGMAYEFLGGDAHCGEPWNRFGAPSALVDCVDHQPTGCTAVLENVLFGNPARCHDPVGWPTFVDWPAPASLTHEQSYYRWIERAWRGGLRTYVNLMVENRVLCELYPIKHNSCDEMTSVRLQIQRLKALERYIDAQSGGPGEGWFRIVYDPFEARRVINEGKLAVIMGMEVSEPFGCRLVAGASQCTPEEVVAGVDELHSLGIRQLEIVNKFDNGLTGVAGDSGTTGTITNTGNFASTGSFWDYETCTDPHNHDRSPAAVHNVDQGLANGLDALLPAGALPAYPPEPHCNQLGLSTQGVTAVNRIIDRKMVFDPDHMSVIGRGQAMDLIEAQKYPGIISSHSWSTDNTLERITKLGGMITPYAGGSEGFVNQWRKLRRFRDQFGTQFFGIGYGADMNGFGAQGDPRGAGVPNPVTYPFKSIDGSTTIHKQVSGQRVYDINSDGVAHYGLYPDWMQDLRMIAGDEIIEDLSRGAEAYLQMWERTNGVPAGGCKAWPGKIKPGGIGSMLRLGADPQSALFAAGQPESRAAAWRWCALDKKRAPKKGKKKKRRQAVAAAKRPVVGVFDSSQRVALALSASRNHTARGLGAGTKLRVLRKKAKRVGGKVYAIKAGKGRQFVFVARKGRVRYAGVAAASLKKPGALRAAVRASGLS